MAEGHTHHDLLLLSHLVESYHNLTRKVLYTFQWADENLKLSYLLKCDDDSYVRLKTMTQKLAKRTSTIGLYWGQIIKQLQSQVVNGVRRSGFSVTTIFIMPWAVGM